MDFSKVYANYCYKANKPTYSRKLLRHDIMGDFDIELSKRLVDTKTATEISYIYLEGMKKLDFRTIHIIINKVFERV